MEVVSFLEERISISDDYQEQVAENHDSEESLAAYVQRKHGW
jgi:hypothetical protein